MHINYVFDMSQWFVTMLVHSFIKIIFFLNLQWWHFDICGTPWISCEGRIEQNCSSHNGCPKSNQGILYFVILWKGCCLILPRLRVNDWLILSFKVVITNLEANSAIEVDAKKWPDAQADDASAFYKVRKLYMQRLGMSSDTI